MIDIRYCIDNLWHRNRIFCGFSEHVYFIVPKIHLSPKRLRYLPRFFCLIIIMNWCFKLILYKSFILISMVCVSIIRITWVFSFTNLVCCNSELYIWILRILKHRQGNRKTKYVNLSCAYIILKSFSQKTTFKTLFIPNLQHLLEWLFLFKL